MCESKTRVNAFAKAGDRIKVTRPFDTNGLYKKGDVLTVFSSPGFFGGVLVDFPGYGTYYLAPREFEVVE